MAQLGGHSFARTHRPSNGMIGAELVFALQKEVPLGAALTLLLALARALLLTLTLTLALSVRLPR